MSLDENNNDEKIDWRHLLSRKERPLPKAGCSWAFYIFLVAMIIYLIIMYVRYKG